MEHSSEEVILDSEDFSQEVAGKAGINFSNILGFAAVAIILIALILVFRTDSSSQVIKSVPETRAIDFGNTSIRGTSQWMQIGQFAALILALFIDTAQKKWRIKDDEKRGSMTNIKFRLTQIWLAPIFTAFGVLFLVGNEWEIINSILLEPKQTSAILFAGISFFLAFLTSEGDVGFPAIGLGITSLVHLVQASKTGALISALSLSAESKMYTMKDIFSLLSQSQGAQAKFSFLILSMLAVSITLITFDILVAKEKEENNTVDFLIAVTIGIAILFTGTYLTPAVGIIFVLVGALVMSIFDLEEFDETLALGILIGTFLSVTFPM